MGVVVRCATDAPSLESEASQLAQLLYSVHLAVVLATLAQPTTGWALGLVEVIRKALGWVQLSLPLLKQVLGEGSERLLLDESRPPLVENEVAMSREILRLLFRDNRVLSGVSPGLSAPSEALHLPRVQAFIRAGAPIALVLPAFPAKAPNARKVLGALPDLAEARALEHLSELLDGIESIWAPGARLTVCSDGHVFADVVGVSDAEVDLYRAALLVMIDDGRISWFDLSTALGAGQPANLREHLLASYGASTQSLRDRAAKSPPLAAQVDGIHRFLFEDEVVLHPELTRSQAKKQTRDRAYEVVRRSEAWGALIACVFPDALRLSIHPQPDPSTKIGINLLGVRDPWLTPWHAAAVVDRTGTVLMHRADAEELGARLVLDGSRPSHLELP
jgi:pyoverdine/dityrosine biosynthesis protein Dit1